MIDECDVASILDRLRDYLRSDAVEPNGMATCIDVLRLTSKALFQHTVPEGMHSVVCWKGKIQAYQ